MLRRNAPFLALAAALLGSAVLLMTWAAQLTFFQDTWAFLMHRQGFTADAFLEPHNEHIVLIPVAIQKLLLAIFGMSSAAPEFAVLTLFLCINAVLVFLYVRRRLGPWPGVFAGVLLLFVGPAWQVLLWPFEVGFVGAVMCGMAMLLALENDDRRWDAAACGLLVLSLGFSTLGLSFAAAAAVDVLLRLRSRGWRRAYIVVVPMILFAAWYLGWGHSAESHLSAHNVLVSPRFLFEGVASSIDSLLGLGTVAVDGEGSPTWGVPLLIAAMFAVAYSLWRGRRISPRFWPIAAATASFWLLAGFNYIPGREAVASRYAYAGAAFVLLMAADLLRGVRFGRPALWVGAAITVAALVSNLGPLKEGRDLFREQAVLTKSELGAMQVARKTISPYFGLTPEIAGTSSLIDILASEYFPVEREYGSPAYSPAALETAAPEGRMRADIVLSVALPITTETALGMSLARALAGCVAVPVGATGAAADVRIGPGVTRIGLAPGPHAEFSLRRFASDEYPVPTEGAPGGSVTKLTIPADASPVPWHLQVEAQQAAKVCPAR